ncbi:MAG: trypsin-like peptidase domain-containing protein [Myxococcales bacterium]|nr:trypsin-like peptidase domain-containing protein [Myxococcales bacterium]
MSLRPFALAVLAAWPAAAQADRAHRRDAVVAVVESVSPAVVYVGTLQVVERRFRGGMSPLFEEFFGVPERREAVEGLGSGVIIDPAGLILTNDHVIRGAAEIHVVLADGRRLDAEVIGSDAGNDLAVLKVTAKGPLPAAKLGNSSELMIGETVVAIGSPFGLEKTVTVGVVSATGRSFKANGRVYNDFVQTDASINPGNSGGPLLNIDAEVIGINTAIYASARGIGFAIPADKVRRILRELTQFGKVRPAWVGLRVSDITAQLARRLSWDRNYGAMVAEVEAESPAERAGVQRSDIVANVGGSAVNGAEDFEARLRGYPAGTNVEMTVFRGGQPLEVKFEAVEFPARLADSLVWERLGLRLKEARGGLWISGVRPGSSAEQVGLEPQDALLRLNNLPTRTLAELQELVIAARTSSSVLLLVRRGRTGYYITLPF